MLLARIKAYNDDFNCANDSDDDNKTFNDDEDDNAVTDNDEDDDDDDLENTAKGQNDDCETFNNSFKIRIKIILYSVIKIQS